MEKINPTTSSNSYTIELSFLEQEEIEKIAFELRKINPIKNADLFCEKAKQLSKQIPIRNTYSKNIE